MNNVATAFEHTRVPYGDDGKLVRGIIARCGAPYCGAAVPLPVNAIAGFKASDAEVEWQFIARKLEQKGWRVGRSRNSHRCPKCAAKLEIVRNKPEEKPMANNKSETPLQVVQENARVMTRDDRRIVFEKLNEVYLNDKVGYAKGWTDEKVAVDLGVPRAWVRLIREENFGDEVGNEDIREQVREAQTMLAQVRAIEPEMRRLLGMSDKIERSLAEIQKVLK